MSAYEYANRNRGDPILNHIANFIFWTLAIAILLHIEGFHPKIESPHTYIPASILSLLLISIVNVRIAQSLGTSGIVFLATIIIYLIISYIVATFQGIEVSAQMYRTSGIKICFMVIFIASALGGYIVMETQGIETTFLWILRIFTVTSAVIAFSPVLIGWGLPLVEDSSFRHSAPFAGPNEAGAVGCLTVTMAIVFIRLSKHKLLAYIALFTGLIATVLTGSRSALITSSAIFIFFLLFTKRRTPLFLLLLIPLVPLIFFQEQVIGYLSNYIGVHIHRFIAATLIETGLVAPWQYSLLGGGIESNQGSRLILWEIGLQQALQSPVFGNGLGQGHNLENAPFTSPGAGSSVRYGVHNLYLLLFIEAGFIPVLLYLIYLFSILCLFLSVPTSLARDIIVGWAIVLMLISVTSHHLFILKELAFIIGLSCATSQLLNAQAPPVRQPALSPGQPRPIRPR